MGMQSWQRGSRTLTRIQPYWDRHRRAAVGESHGRRPCPCLPIRLPRSTAFEKAASKVSASSSCSWGALHRLAPSIWQRTWTTDTNPPAQPHSRTPTGRRACTLLRCRPRKRGARRAHDAALALTVTQVFIRRPRLCPMRTPIAETARPSAPRPLPAPRVPRAGAYAYRDWDSWRLGLAWPRSRRCSCSGRGSPRRTTREALEAFAGMQKPARAARQQRQRRAGKTPRLRSCRG